ncbi:hypothetical protein [Frigidibacter sp. MR17.24]|uniref:hypothetical protein n=1 Tax=Frigidibacter sp. MR17.24 TaxID=3127345 RepID=UPI003012EF71
MSDPLSKREIEDVLSSIRRLVADERRGARDHGQPLVLTPAQRVAPMPAMATRGALRASLEETIAELEAAVAAAPRADRLPADAGEERAEGARGRMGTEALAQFEAELAAALGRPLPLADDGSDEDEPATAEALNPSTDLTARIAEAAARVRRRGVPPQPAEPEDDLSLEWAAAGEPVEAPAAAPEPAKPAADWQDEPVRVRRLHLAGGLDWQPPPVPSAAGEAWQDPAGASAAGAAAGTATGESDAAGTTAPDAVDRGPDRDPHRGAEWDAERAWDEEMAGAAGPRTASEAAPEDDLLLDEQALRTMVAQIVREELQGALGERITTAVRKLVRREIARALEGRAFD